MRITSTLGADRNVHVRYAVLHRTRVGCRGQVRARLEVGRTTWQTTGVAVDPLQVLADLSHRQRGESSRRDGLSLLLVPLWGLCIGFFLATTYSVSLSHWSDANDALYTTLLTAPISFGSGLSVGAFIKRRFW